MTRSSWAERIAMRLARAIAGPERSHWLDAMEAELRTLSTGRLDWALGSLVAAVKDRSVRDRQTLALLAVLPACAAIAVLPVTAIAAAVVRAAGLSMDLLGPVLFPIPFACAMVLGAALPWRRPAVAGSLGFAIHQAGPSAFLHFVTGSSFGFSVPNLWQYGLHPAFSVAGTLAAWCLGTMLGARIGKRHRRLPKPR